MKEEAQLQRSICDYLSYACPEVIYWAIPNGFIADAGPKKFARINHMKATGLRKGAPDLVLHWPQGGHCYIEVKSRAGRLSQDQIDLHKKLIRNGFTVFIVRKITDLYQIIKELKIPCRDSNVKGIA